MFVNFTQCSSCVVVSSQRAPFKRKELNVIFRYHCVFRIHYFYYNDCVSKSYLKYLLDVDLTHLVSVLNLSYCVMPDLTMFLWHLKHFVIVKNTFCTCKQLHYFHYENIVLIYSGRTKKLLLS